MVAVYLCLAAYTIFIASDFVSLVIQGKLPSILFWIGMVILISATVYVISTSDLVSVFQQNHALAIAMAVIAVIFLGLFTHSLFSVLLANATDIKSEKRQLADTGVYALCRHPGVIWLTLFFLFAWLFADNIMMLWLGISNTVMDIVYVTIQDIFIFPKTISGYDEYKKYTPFLIPNVRSVKRAIETYIQKNRV